ncbi:unnamed protein product, partial [Amoebophrya sp. A120]
ESLFPVPEQELDDERMNERSSSLKLPSVNLRTATRDGPQARCGQQRQEHQQSVSSSSQQHFLPQQLILSDSDTNFQSSCGGSKKKHLQEHDDCHYASGYAVQRNAYKVVHTTIKAASGATSEAGFCTALSSCESTAGGGDSGAVPRSSTTTCGGGSAAPGAPSTTGGAADHGGEDVFG